MAGNGTYVRWQRDQPRVVSTFPPLGEDHPAVLAPCAFCAEPLGDGRRVALVAIGPARHDRHRHDTGRWYCALAVLTHADDVRSLSEDELAAFVSELRSTSDGGR
ncbi:hypothetical protein NLX83_39680 [Allokutzneria sp. A3M-2-11 16]|uniref:hypothetical protein n=1 Tax=Allokutzneria sp. A3M-2-11 16 TaxID=2962043 RepID=UPI0020B72694|nr:hypothetical protein [Allokutzneria sp. A3M-2-11 16]MCP3805406.1 hypothetical protein [Allokutzneria sp. A3M-2-11 16]